MIFAIIAYDKLYFKVDETNKPVYEKYGSKPFTYTQKGRKETSMSYWELPADIMEDKEKIKDWVKTSYTISKKRK